MSEPPPAYEALQNPYVPTETKQPPSNPDFPPNPTMPAGNYAMPPQPGSIPIQTIIVGSVAFNQNPSSMTCPHCHQQVLVVLLYPVLRRLVQGKYIPTVLAYGFLGH
ncbi:unnamed protein product [Heligmosomoides polygyrus]|uniref:LITAF domain-containing protein n=1 Tax=Heligmosomoides polygyrus TaxID=6339 RepID=A0A3P8A0T0_HELPZ|nr:unnamed protein product [Heligmosomoides polygyrus]